VRDLSFTIAPREVLGLVGESGSGKSITSLAVMRLLPLQAHTSGKIVFTNGHAEPRNLLEVPDDEMRGLRGSSIAMIFQEPMTALNPVMRVGEQIAESILAHADVSKSEAWQRAVEGMKDVAIPDAERRARDYPHQLSGGMRQRVMIAMAIVNRPTLLIADEPTTALDVTIQAQILDLLRQVNRDFGTATILITHNLGVVAGMCERVMVMYAGRVVESGPTVDVFAHPKHPYTWSLLRSIPRLDAERHEPLKPIDGLPPDLIDLPSGCAFHPRCQFKIERCSRDTPVLNRVGDTQLAACWVTQSGVELKGA
jgi:oligopeptide/dipeptide ABC transporter ATP-binding protein